MSGALFNDYKCWKIYHDRHVFCLYFWQSRCKLFFKASILASLGLLGNMHINFTLLVLACNYYNSPLASLASASCKKKERQYNKKKVKKQKSKSTFRICLKWKVLVFTKHITKVHTSSVPYIKVRSMSIFFSSSSIHKSWMPFYWFRF